jgi:DNA end-binding protein Ku
MPRALWKGSLAFGLESIPVELHTAVRDHRPRFRMLHAKDSSPVKFERICIRDGHPVAWEDMERLRKSLGQSAPARRRSVRAPRQAARTSRASA